MTSNKKRGEEALTHLEREIKARDRKDKARPFGVVIASLVAILAIGGGITYMATQGGDEEVVADDANANETEAAPEEQEVITLAGQRETPLEDTVQCEYNESGEAARDVDTPTGEDISAEGTVTVNFTTNQGEIPMELDRALAPCTVNAITDLAGTRLLRRHGLPPHDHLAASRSCSAVTQPAPDLAALASSSQMSTQLMRLKIQILRPSTHVDPLPWQTLAQTRMALGAFLNYADSTLAPNYTYFGDVTEEGLETLDAIAEKGVEGGASDGAPAEEVRIESATVA